MTSATVAVIGGGQLARMMQQAAIELDVHLRVLVEEPEGSAGQVVPDVLVSRGLLEAQQIADLAEGADALTFEHDHVGEDLLRPVLDAGGIVQPSPRALAFAHDKAAMRRRLESLVPCPRWTVASSRDELAQAFAEGLTVVKTPLGGYDGKGVWFSPGLDTATELLANGPLLVEEAVRFSREIAILLARRRSGQITIWPIAETTQRDGMCAEVLAPAPGLRAEDVAQLERIGRTVATELDVTGILAVEMFELTSPGPDGGRFVVNELAMRPHNSGHWTMDGAATSQFSQHLRAILDWPLGPVTLRKPVTAMANVIGHGRIDPADQVEKCLAADPEVSIHLYGKAPRDGRKLGHVNVSGDDPHQVRSQAERAARILSHGEV